MLVAPDKFKGTMSAAEVAGAIAAGLADAAVSPVERLPVADGGEGTADAMLRAHGGETVAVDSEDPLGRAITASFAVLAGGDVAVVEAAEASGLWRLAPGERDAEAATTRGTGMLIRAAVEAGAREVVVAVGGTATTDGGRGALEALGARVDDRLDLESLHRALRGVRLTVACDVESPLLGPRGAAFAFGPQKGADAEAVARLEARLEAWARLAVGATGRDPRTVSRAGAGGGLAGGIWAFAGAELVGGADYVLDALDFDRRALAARAVITGEGQLDAQTVEGKAVYRVIERCRRHAVPVFAIVGRAAVGAESVAGAQVIEAARGGRDAGPDDLRAAAIALARALP